MLFRHIRDSHIFLPLGKYIDLANPSAKDPYTFRERHTAVRAREDRPFPGISTSLHSHKAEDVHIIRARHGIFHETLHLNKQQRLVHRDQARLDFLFGRYCPLLQSCCS